LVGYFESFYERTQPLSLLPKVYAKLADFDAQFEAGQVPGWADRGEGPATDGASSVFDLAAFASVEEVETLGECAQSGILAWWPCVPVRLRARVSVSKFLVGPCCTHGAGSCIR
jgi:hypothetical protein